jgi:hypothetical protein
MKHFYYNYLNAVNMSRALGCNVLKTNPKDALRRSRECDGSCRCPLPWKLALSREESEQPASTP